MRKLRFLVLAATAASALLGQANPPKTQLKVGDDAPDFTLPSTTGQTGKTVRFSRQEERRPGLLPRGLHRRLHEGDAGVPGWYRQI